MTATIYDPMTVNETTLTYTNLTESTSEWSASATYNAGDEVHVASTHMVYVSAINANVGINPATDGGSSWIVKSSMNKWAAFDAYMANKASRGGFITYEITANQIVNGIGLFGLEADRVTVTVTNGDFTETYTSPILDLSHIGGSWYNWFFGGRPRKTTHVFNNIAYFGTGTTYRITIRSPGTARVGQVVLGKAEHLGETLENAAMNMRDTTLYREDDYANLQITRRPIYFLHEVEIFNNKGTADRTKKIIKKLSGVPTFFTGAENTELGLTVFGVLLSAEPTVNHQRYHQISLTFRELV